MKQHDLPTIIERGICAGCQDMDKLYQMIPGLCRYRCIECLIKPEEVAEAIRIAKEEAQP